MRKWLLLFCAASLACLADQVAKGWVVANLLPYESVQPIPALAPFFQLTRNSNSGAAFGILPMAGDVFLVIALFIVGALLWHVRSLGSESRLAPIAVGMAVGGAVGNIMDRLQHGHVIDFIHYQIPNLISNVSNLADHAIVLGVALLIAESLWRDRGVRLAKAIDERERASGS